MKRQNPMVWLFIVLAAAAYAACLQLPAISYKAYIESTPCMNGPPQKLPDGTWSCGAPKTMPPSTDSGFEVLKDGWLGILIYNFAWWANVLALAAFVAALGGGSPGAASALALSGFAFGLQSFVFDKKPNYGGSIPVDHLAAGFYVWEGVFLLLALSQWIAWRWPAAPREEGGGKTAAF